MKLSDQNQYIRFIFCKETDTEFRLVESHVHELYPKLGYDDTLTWTTKKLQKYMQLKLTNIDWIYQGLKQAWCL